MGVRQRSTLTVDLVGDGDRAKARVGQPVVLNFSKPDENPHDHHHQQQQQHQQQHHHHRRIAYLRWATGFRSVFSWTAAHCCSCLLSRSGRGPTDRGDALRRADSSIPSLTGDRKLRTIPRLLEAPVESEERVRPEADESSDRDECPDRDAQSPDRDERLLTVDELEDYVPGDGETFGREKMTGRGDTSRDESPRRAHEEDDVEISVIQTTLKAPPHHQYHHQQQNQHYNSYHHYGRYRDVFYRHGVVTSTASFVLQGGEMKSALVPRASLLGDRRVFTSRADLFVSSGVTAVDEARGEMNIGSRPWVCVSV